MQALTRLLKLSELTYLLFIAKKIYNFKINITSCIRVFVLECSVSNAEINEAKPSVWDARQSITS